MLVVEDDLDVLFVLEQMFQEDFPVKTATSVQDARKAIESKDNFELILFDFHLPDGTGYDLMNYAKEINYNCDFVSLSGNLSQENREKLRDLGIKWFVAKPFDPAALFDLISKIISQNEEIQAQG